MDEAEHKEGTPGEIKVPPWVIVGVFIVGWIVGPFVAVFTTLVGDYNIVGYGFAGWLITLPFIATRPLEALARLAGRR